MTMLRATPSAKVGYCTVETQNLLAGLEEPDRAGTLGQIATANPDSILRDRGLWPRSGIGRWSGGMASEPSDLAGENSLLIVEHFHLLLDLGDIRGNMSGGQAGFQAAVALYNEPCQRLNLGR